jgi:signal transduction histidine kinase
MRYRLETRFPLQPEPKPPSEGRFSFRLFVAFLAVGLAFVASSVYANWLSIEIGGESRQLTDNALPSIDRLTAAVDGLRDLEAATDDYPELAPPERASARRGLADLWRHIDGDLDAYLALPAFPGERDLYADVPASLRELEGSIQRLFADADSGDRERARATADRDVRGNANRSAALLRQLVRFNTGQARASSARIEATRNRVLLIAGTLDGVMLALTVAVAIWIGRIFRSYVRLEREHARMVERRAEELEVFGRRVAHDLLSPLASLTYCLVAFKPVSRGDPKLEDALDRAGQCVRRAQLLVDNVFDFARSGGAPAGDARVDVREVVEQVADEALAVDASERPEVVCGPIPDVAVQCSRGVLASILGNLVRNAIKYMRDSSVRRVTIRVVEEGELVRFEVEDTGPGVPPRLEEAIFEPYVRAEGVTQPGLGLGLATVKRFCEAYGGSVGVRSTSGTGAVFHFTLRRAPREAPAPPAPASGKVLRDAS